MDACPGLYASIAADLRKGRPRAYESHGAIILKSLWYYDEHSRGKPIWYACDLGSSDLDAARAALKCKIGKRAIYRIGPHSDECSLVFSRMGEPYDDPDIRQLTEDDRKQILEILAVPADDSYEAKAIAEVIRESLADTLKCSDKYLLGIFDGADLAGLLKLSDENSGELMHIDDVFVPRQHRGRKYAPRLIRAATAMVPGARYVYSCGSENAASIASAQSAGFALAGSCLFG